VATGAIGNYTMVYAPKAYAIESGWLMFSLAADLALAAGGSDLNGAITLYMGDMPNSTAIDIRDGTNIRYLYNMRVTRPTT
jgi:hypothetical protein